MAQRSHARFVNTTMMLTTLGAAVSDGLDDGRVVSGVGGQYNFVTMAHALPGARSVLCVRSTRRKDGKRSSNIVTSYGHITIPRHLRDIAITEYGIADLRGRTDAECVAAMLNIADSRFQEELLADAKRANKIDAGYRIPEEFAATRRNVSRKPSPRSGARGCSRNIRSAPISRARKSTWRARCAGSRKTRRPPARRVRTIARALFTRPREGERALSRASAARLAAATSRRD